MSKENPAKIEYKGFVPDSIVDTIINKFVTRAEMGYNKYSNTLDRNDLTPTQWIEHALEEHMDAILYLTKIKKELEDRGIK
jgi:hypothetical protein